MTRNHKKLFIKIRLKTLFVAKFTITFQIKTTTLTFLPKCMPTKTKINVFFAYIADIQIKLLLNFPKIKKVLRDEDKLWEYLTSDEKR